MKIELKKLKKQTGYQLADLTAGQVVKDNGGSIYLVVENACDALPSKYVSGRKALVWLREGGYAIGTGLAEAILDPDNPRTIVEILGTLEVSTD